MIEYRIIVKADNVARLYQGRASVFRKFTARRDSRALRDAVLDAFRKALVENVPVGRGAEALIERTRGTRGGFDVLEFWRGDLEHGTWRCVGRSVTLVPPGEPYIIVPTGKNDHAS